MKFALTLFVLSFLSVHVTGCKTLGSRLQEDAGPGAHEMPSPESRYWDSRDPVDLLDPEVRAALEDPNRISENVAASIPAQRFRWQERDAKGLHEIRIFIHEPELGHLEVNESRILIDNRPFEVEKAQNGIGPILIDPSNKNFGTGTPNQPQQDPTSNPNKTPEINNKPNPSTEPPPSIDPDTTGKNAPRGSRSGEFERKSIEYKNIDDFRNDVQADREKATSGYNGAIAAAKATETSSTAKGQINEAVKNHNNYVRNLKSSFPQLNQIASEPDKNFETSPSSIEGQNIRRAAAYASRARRAIEDSNFPDKQQRLSSLALAEGLIDLADKQYAEGSIEDGNATLKTSLSIIDTVAGFVPGISLAKDIGSLIAQRNLITGEALDPADNALIIAGLLAPSILSGTSKATSKFLSALNKSKVGSALKGRITAAVSTIADQVKNFRNPARAALDTNVSAIAGVVGTSYAGLLKSTLNKVMKSGVKVSPATARYLGRLAKSGKYSLDELADLATSRAKLEARMSGLTGIKTSVKVTRGVPRNIVVDGKVIATNTDLTVYAKHPGMLDGGRFHTEGTAAIYAAEGSGPKAWETVFAEMGESAQNDIVMESTDMSFNNLLDLTNPRILEAIKVTNLELLDPSSGGTNLSRQIGDIAKSLGFDGIRAPSARIKPSNNIIKFLDE